MPLDIECPFDEKSISINEYFEKIKSMKYDFYNHEDLIDSAKYLNQLNNNKTILLDYLCEELKNFGDFQSRNLYGPQVFIFGRQDVFFLRAVIWNPISNAEKLVKDFKYDIFHDHNFDFLTAGHFGPGYKSRCYTYDYSNVIGVLGEKVDLIPQGVVTLSEGKIMLYRSKFDVHEQIPPESLSISINVIIENKEVDIPQFQFDDKTHKICKYIHNSNNDFVIRIVGLLGDENSIEPLLNILKKNKSMKAKALSAQSIIQINNRLKFEIEERIENLNNPIVSDIYFKETNRYWSSNEMFT